MMSSILERSLSQALGEDLVNRILDQTCSGCYDPTCVCWTNSGIFNNDVVSSNNNPVMPVDDDDDASNGSSSSLEKEQVLFTFTVDETSNSSSSNMLYTELESVNIPMEYISTAAVVPAAAQEVTLSSSESECEAPITSEASFTSGSECEAPLTKSKKKPRKRGKPRRPPARAQSEHAKPMRKAKITCWLVSILDSPEHGDVMQWLDRDRRTFRILDQDELAYLWGVAKGNSSMNYEKFSRAMRYYYKRKELVIVRKKLIYQFGPRAIIPEL